uniref:Uncharacterized protein n=1 Tax=Picea sitchensis TaxID=3332 RepID=A0A6B9XUL6_PICSI|nr:hypothetical protein Q903MT_gene3718 [Picea sitchensis]
MPQHPPIEGDHLQIEQTRETARVRATYLPGKRLYSAHHCHISMCLLFLSFLD